MASAPHGGLWWILCDGYVSLAPHGGLGWMSIVRWVRVISTSWWTRVDGYCVTCFTVYHLMSWVG